MADASPPMRDERRARGFAPREGENFDFTASRQAPSFTGVSVPTPCSPFRKFDNISASYPVHAMIAPPEMEILGANSVEATAVGRHRGDRHVHCHEPLSS
jgi:hypothetical protein